MADDGRRISRRKIRGPHVQTGDEVKMLIEFLRHLQEVSSISKSKIWNRKRNERKLTVHYEKSTLVLTVGGQTTQQKLYIQTITPEVIVGKVSKKWLDTYRNAKVVSS